MWFIHPQRVFKHAITFTNVMEANTTKQQRTETVRHKTNNRERERERNSFSGHVSVFSFFLTTQQQKALHGKQYLQLLELYIPFFPFWFWRSCVACESFFLLSFNDFFLFLFKA